jgi:hypothetical protein
LAARTSGIEDDVDLPGALRDAVEIFIHGGVIEGVNGSHER